MASAPPGAETKIVQGWPKLWANYRALIGIFSQISGPSLVIWANPVQLSLGEPDHAGAEQAAGPRPPALVEPAEDRAWGPGRNAASDAAAPSVLTTRVRSG
jgi:hypothetical protein